MAIRGYLTATCRKHVPHLYSLRMDDCSEDLRVQVELLLQDDSLVFTLQQGRLAYFASPQIADILEKHLFEKPDHYGRDPVLRSYFQPLRLVTISLAATAVLYALNNLRTGRNEHSLKPGTEEWYYKAFQETWENMSPVRQEAICKAIYERIALRTGLRADERVDMPGYQDDFGDNTSDLTDLLPMTAEQGRLLMTGEGRTNHAHRAATGYTSQISEGRSSYEQTAIAVVPAEDGTALESIPEDRPMLISIGRRVRNQMT
ncbi:hypothetical protein BDZ91DRAFT_769091 [Kalaharituber pfeilii]|nr:hypothetical protein BDZ91DRAFT_769091 [Kalaharituber pfeilii]